MSSSRPSPLRGFVPGVGFLGPFRRPTATLCPRDDRTVTKCGLGTRVFIAETRPAASRQYRGRRGDRRHQTEEISDEDEAILGLTTRRPQGPDEQQK